MTDAIHLADLPFYTIQGEGASAGRPAFFIRVQGCTVGCDFCDTRYSWSEDPKRGFFVPYKDILTALAKIPRSAVIVLTGGEPYEHVEELCSMLGYVDHGKHQIEVETSGYIYDSRLNWCVDQITISPKILPSALIRPDKMMSDETLSRWLLYDRQTAEVTWKFVIRNQPDLDAFLSYYNRWSDKNWILPPKRVYLMPEAMTAEQNVGRGKWLAEVCKEYGFNLSLRQHVMLWGAKRGT